VALGNPIRALAKSVIAGAMMSPTRTASPFAAACQPARIGHRPNA